MCRSWRPALRRALLGALAAHGGSLDPLWREPARLRAALGPPSRLGGVRHKRAGRAVARKWPPERVPAAFRLPAREPRGRRTAPRRPRGSAVARRLLDDRVLQRALTRWVLSGLDPCTYGHADHRDRLHQRRRIPRPRWQRCGSPRACITRGDANHAHEALPFDDHRSLPGHVQIARPATPTTTNAELKSPPSRSGDSFGDRRRHGHHGDLRVDRRAARQHRRVSHPHTFDSA